MGYATFDTIVEMCNEVGWEKGISELEKETYKLEILQADLFAGTPAQIRQAIKLSSKITKQNHTIARLKQYKHDHIDNA